MNIFYDKKQRNTLNWNQNSENKYKWTIICQLKYLLNRNFLVTTY